MHSWCDNTPHMLHRLHLVTMKSLQFILISIAQTPNVLKRHSKFGKWIQYSLHGFKWNTGQHNERSSTYQHCSLLKHGTTTRCNQKSSVRNILSKQLVVRVPILYHNPIIVARVTCIVLICLSPVVSGLRFIYGLRQERVLFLLVHVARLTCITLICMSPVVSGLCLICGLYSLSEECVVILLCLQAHLCWGNELAQSGSVVLSLLHL